MNENVVVAPLQHALYWLVADMNECMSNPCQMGGRCIDLFQSFFCDCANNFSGERCTRRE